jgi:hypothetical protein
LNKKWDKVVDENECPSKNEISDQNPNTYRWLPPRCCAKRGLSYAEATALRTGDFSGCYNKRKDVLGWSGIYRTSEWSNEPEWLSKKQARETHMRKVKRSVKLHPKKNVRETVANLTEKAVKWVHKNKRLPRNGLGGIR